MCVCVCVFLNCLISLKNHETNMTCSFLHNKENIIMMIIKLKQDFSLHIYTYKKDVFSFSLLYLFSSFIYIYINIFDFFVFLFVIFQQHRSYKAYIHSLLLYHSGNNNDNNSVCEQKLQQTNDKKSKLVLFVGQNPAKFINQKILYQSLIRYQHYIIIIIIFIQFTFRNKIFTFTVFAVVCCWIFSCILRSFKDKLVYFLLFNNLIIIIISRIDGILVTLFALI